MGPEEVRKPDIIGLQVWVCWTGLEEEVFHCHGRSATGARLRISTVELGKHGMSESAVSSPQPHNGYLVFSGETDLSLYSNQRMEGPKFSKRRRLGKNKKKSWRGIDITETEDFLEDQRFQERTTGLFSEKTDDQLFTIERQRPDASEAPKRKAKKELNCYSSLVNQSRIQCPRKEYPTSENYRTRSLRAFTKKSDARRQTTTETDQPQSSEEEEKDLWGEGKGQTEGEDFFNEVTKRRRVKTPRHIRRKCSERAKVELPHPGASVNPAYDDHQDLLLQAHTVESKKQRAERKIFNALDAKFPSLTDAPSQATWMAEMSVGLYDNPTAADAEVGDDAPISINPPVDREKKKTPRQKRKEKARKLRDQLVAQEKTKKNTENKVYSIGKIRSLLAKERREMAERGKVRAEKAEAMKYLPKKLGKTKVETPDLELKLSEELVGSLRSVKPEGHLLEDRYRSLQMRNIIEPRAKVNKKKVKTKKFEKKSFREITA